MLSGIVNELCPDNSPHLLYFGQGGHFFDIQNSGGVRLYPGLKKLNLRL